MGKPAAVRTGDGPAGVGVEYVRRRSVVRVFGWHEGHRTIGPLEVPLSAFCEQLGIDAEDCGPARRFLLFAGSLERSGGGLRDLAGTFDAVEAAREAFHRIRAEGSGQGRWAQLVALEGDGRLSPLCWFGRPTPLEPVRTGWWQADHQPAAQPASPAPARSRRWQAGRRWRAVPVEAGRPVGATG